MIKVDVMLIDKNNEVWYLYTTSDYSGLTCKKAMERFVNTYKQGDNIKSKTNRRIIFVNPIKNKRISSKVIYGITANIN